MAVVRRKPVGKVRQTTCKFSCALASGWWSWLGRCLESDCAAQPMNNLASRAQLSWAELGSGGLSRAGLSLAALGLGLGWAAGVHGMNWNEIVCSKLMLDRPTLEPRALQNQPPRLPGVFKFAFGIILSSKLSCHGSSGQPLGHSGGPSWRSWASFFGLPGIILAYWWIVLDAPGPHSKGPGTPLGHIFLIWQ